MTRDIGAFQKNGQDIGAFEKTAAAAAGRIMSRLAYYGGLAHKGGIAGKAGGLAG